MRNLDYKELNEELEQRTQMLANTANRIKDRFRYRTMLNRSYPIEEANEIELKIEKRLAEIEQEISKMWNLIG